MICPPPPVTGPSTVVSPTPEIATGVGAKTVVVGASETGASVPATESPVATEESLAESSLEQLTNPTTKIGTINKVRIFTMIPRSKSV
jgi:hypothetical protein